VHPLLVPPEALEPTTLRERWGWSVEGVTLTSLLAVTASVTAGVTFFLAPVVVPCTAIVAYGFWRMGRRITQPASMVLYCVGGGAVAGAANVCLMLVASSLFPGGEFLWRLGVQLLGLALLGAAVGVAYGFAYVLPILTQLSARSLRRPEGVDRCLVRYGLWGVIVLGLGFSLLVVFPGAEEAMHDVVFVIAGASFVLHAWMLLIGTLRWARRRAWLARVSRGMVPGWLVCDPQRFDAAELEGLQVFSNPLFTRPPAKRRRVLAWGDGTDAYRSTPLTPKYLVV